MTRRLAVSCVLVLAIRPALAADPAAWQAITTELLKTEKPGFGGLCGVVVDHDTGCLYVNLSDKGIYCSLDQGKTWKKQSTTPIQGRTETPGCFLLDPTGKSKRMLMALVYGAPVMTSADEGATWSAMHARSGHVDWCALDWKDQKFVLALKHESGDLLLASHDGGQSFRDVGKGYGPAWVFDGQTAVVAQARSKDNPKPGLLRTSDAARTFQPCGDYTARALPKWRDGVLYWVVDGALIATTDQGQSWKKQGDLKDGRYGPIFGKDARHMFVLTGAGVVESRDGGASWSAPIPPPKDLKGIGPLTWIDYDPKHDILYLMKMSTDLFQLRRRQ